MTEGQRVELQAVAFVNMGTWKAKCPRPWCPHFDHYGPGPDTGRVGGLGDTLFHCLYCGLTCDAVWPDNRDDIDRILAARPFPMTRNWLPGETIEDLLAENITHALTDPAGLPGGGTTITAGNRLTVAGRRFVASGPAPLQIGR